MKVPVGVYEGDTLVHVYPSVRDASYQLGLSPVAMQQTLNDGLPDERGRVYVRLKREEDGDYECEQPCTPTGEDRLATLAMAARAVEAAPPVCKAAMQLMAFQANMLQQRDQIIRSQAQLIAALLRPRL